MSAQPRHAFIHAIMAVAFVALLVSIGGVVSARSPQQPVHASPDADAWQPPIEATHRTNPLDGRAELSAGGRKVFQQRCAQCHGEHGTGTTRAPDLTRRAVQSQSDGALFWRISAGNAYAGMPSFSYLPELQRWQVVLHLRHLTPPVVSQLSQPAVVPHASWDLIDF